jgi:hypothetical protein
MSIVIPSAVNQNEKAMQHFLNHPMVNSLGSSVPTLIEAVNFQVSYTDAQTKKCILANSHAETLHKGIKALQSPDDLIGLTMADLLEMGTLIPPRILEQTSLKINIDNAIHARMEMLNRLEHEAKITQGKVERPYITILANGFIHSRILVKQPIMSSLDNRKVIAILTCSYDRTPSLSLLDLLSLYLERYPSKFAIKVLLQYLKIAHYFKALPTPREMQVLLLMRDNSHRKYIGKQLNISRNTAASHIQHIKELKLIKPDIDEVTIQLRRVPANLSIDTGNI